MEASSKIDQLGRQAIDIDSSSEARGSEDTTPGPSSEILKLRKSQDPDELSASEPSDGEAEAEGVVALFQFKSHSRNLLHITHELQPTLTACSRDRPILIEELRAVPVTDEELADLKENGELTSGKRLCPACVMARPDRFPDVVLAALAKGPRSTRFEKSLKS